MSQSFNMQQVDFATQSVRDNVTTIAAMRTALKAFEWGAAARIGGPAVGGEAVLSPCGPRVGGPGQNGFRHGAG